MARTLSVLLVSTCLLSGPALAELPANFPKVAEPVAVEAAGVFNGACRSSTKPAPIAAIIAIRPSAAKAGDKVTIHYCEGQQVSTIMSAPDPAKPTDQWNFEAGIYTYKVNPDCTYIVVGGTKVLISGDPAICQ